MSREANRSITDLLLYMVFTVMLSTISSGCSQSSVVLPDPSPTEQLIQTTKIKGKTLPFVFVYGGPKIRNHDALFENARFTHIMNGSGVDRKNIPAQRRAFLWTGVAYGLKDQPWAKHKDPWGNDLAKYELFWTKRLQRNASIYGDNEKLPQVGLMVADIEAKLTPAQALRSRQKFSPSSGVKALSDKAFMEAYQSQMQKMYTAPLRFLARSGLPKFTRVGAYGDVPILRTWFDIEKHSWEDWQTNESRADFLFTQDSEGEQFKNEIDDLYPSAYFFYKSGKNLAYLMFQVEANRAWSDKPVTLFVTPRYVGKKDRGQPITSYLAEASVIFSFLSGAKGFWIWEGARARDAVQDVSTLPVYQGYIRGWQRLHEYAEFFNDGVVKPIGPNPRDMFVKKLPVWRAVVKNRKALVVATNPYALPGVETYLEIEINNTAYNLKLMGNDIVMTEIKLSEN